MLVGRVVLCVVAGSLIWPTVAEAAITKVIWTQGSNVQQTGLTLVKSGGVGGSWDATAISKQRIDGPTGTLTAGFVLSSTAGTARFGLHPAGTAFVVGGAPSIDFGFELSFDTASMAWLVQVRELGQIIATCPSAFASGQRLQIRIFNGVLRYIQGSSICAFSTARASYPLAAVAAFSNTGSGVVDPVMDHRAHIKVHWQKKINVTANPGTLESFLPPTSNMPTPPVPPNGPTLPTPPPPPCTVATPTAPAPSPGPIGPGTPDAGVPDAGPSTPQPPGPPQNPCPVTPTAPQPNPGGPTGPTVPPSPYVSGASSIQPLGTLFFSVEALADMYVGFTTADTGTAITDMAFGFRLSSLGFAEVVETVTGPAPLFIKTTTSVANCGAYTNNTSFKLERTATTVVYYMGLVRCHTSTNPVPAQIFYADAIFASSQVELQNVVFELPQRYGCTTCPTKCQPVYRNAYVPGHLSPAPKGALLFHNAPGSGMGPVLAAIGGRFTHVGMIHSPSRVRHNSLWDQIDNIKDFGSLVFAKPILQAAQGDVYLRPTQLYNLPPGAHQGNPLTETQGLWDYTSYWHPPSARLLQAERGREAQAAASVDAAGQFVGPTPHTPTWPYRPHAFLNLPQALSTQGAMCSAYVQQATAAGGSSRPINNWTYSISKVEQAAHSIFNFYFNRADYTIKHSRLLCHCKWGPWGTGNGCTTRTISGQSQCIDTHHCWRNPNPLDPNFLKKEYYCLRGGALISRSNRHSIARGMANQVVNCLVAPDNANRKCTDTSIAWQFATQPARGGGITATTLSPDDIIFHDKARNLGATDFEDGTATGGYPAMVQPSFVSGKYVRQDLGQGVCVP